MLIKRLIGAALIGGCLTALAQVPCPSVKTGDGPCYDKAKCDYEKCMKVAKTYQCYTKYCADLAACDATSGGGGGGGSTLPTKPVFPID